MSGGGAQSSVPGEQPSVQDLGQADECGVVGGEVVAEFPDAVEQRFVRVAVEVEVPEISQCVGGASFGQLPLRTIRRRALAASSSNR